MCTAGRRKVKISFYKSTTPSAAAAFENSLALLGKTCSKEKREAPFSLPSPLLTNDDLAERRSLLFPSKIRSFSSSEAGPGVYLMSDDWLSDFIPDPRRGNASSASESRSEHENKSPSSNSPPGHGQQVSASLRRHSRPRPSSSSTPGPSGGGPSSSRGSASSSHTVQDDLPRSVRNAPPEMRHAIRKRQNSEVRQQGVRKSSLTNFLKCLFNLKSIFAW